MIPTGTHTDWPFFLRWVPRRWTAREGPPPTHVHYSKNFDHVHNHPDIPNRGASALSFSKYGFSYAHTSRSGLLFAVGTFRYDYEDMYYELGRFTIKRIA